jgi:hypothetical protein
MSTLTTRALRPLAIIAAVAVLALATPAVASAAEGADAKPAHQHDAGNEKCPMCDKKVGADALKVEFKAEKCKHPEMKGALVAVCSQECGDKLKADPAKYEEQVWNASKFHRR